MSPAVAPPSPAQLLRTEQGRQLQRDAYFLEVEKEDRPSPTGPATTDVASLEKGPSSEVPAASSGFDWGQVVSFLASAAAANSASSAGQSSATDNEAKRISGAKSEFDLEKCSSTEGSRRRRREESGGLAVARQSACVEASCAVSVKRRSRRKGYEEASAARRGSRGGGEDDVGEDASEELTLESIEEAFSPFLDTVTTENGGEAASGSVVEKETPPSPSPIAYSSPSPPSPSTPWSCSTTSSDPPSASALRRKHPAASPPCAQCDSLRQQLLALKLRGLGESGSEVSRALEAAVDAKQTQLEAEQKKVEEISQQLQKQQERASELEARIEEGTKRVDALKEENRRLAERIKLQALAEAEQQQVLEETLEQLRRLRSDNARLRRLVESNGGNASFALSCSSRSSSVETLSSGRDGDLSSPTPEVSLLSATAIECAQSELSSVESIDDYIFDFTPSQHAQEQLQQESKKVQSGNKSDQAPLTCSSDCASKTTLSELQEDEKGTGGKNLQLSQETSSSFPKGRAQTNSARSDLNKHRDRLVAVVDAASRGEMLPVSKNNLKLAEMCSVCGADASLQELYVQVEEVFGDWEAGYSRLIPGTEGFFNLEFALVDLWQPLIKRAARSVTSAKAASLKKAALWRQQRVLLFVLCVLLEKAHVFTDAEQKAPLPRGEQARRSLCISLALVEVWARDQTRRYSGSPFSAETSGARTSCVSLCQSCKRGSPVELFKKVRASLLALLGNTRSV